MVQGVVMDLSKGNPVGSFEMSGLERSTVAKRSEVASSSRCGTDVDDVYKGAGKRLKMEARALKGDGGVATGSWR
eukprot:10262539-Lingulodinium_polyedra.AAC.1